MVKDSEHSGLTYKFAYLLSRLFDTPIMTFEIFLVFLFKDRVELNWLAVILLGDLILPMIYLVYSYSNKHISDLDITNRKEREVWYTVLATCWILTLVVGFLLRFPIHMLVFQTWLTVFGVLDTVITFFWKISGHAMLSTSLVLWLSFLWNPFYIIFLVIFVPLICWARLRTGKHTIPQLVVGTLLMLVVTPIIRFLFAHN